MPQQSKNPDNDKPNTDELGLFGENYKPSIEFDKAVGQSNALPSPTNVEISPQDYDAENLNPLITDINLQRAQDQPHWKQALNGLGQAATGLTGGILEGVGYTMNIPGMVSKAVSDSEATFGQILASVVENNDIAEAGRELTDWGRKVFPAYAEDPGSFDPTDTAFWANLAPSIVSTLSLLIPARLGTAAITTAGRVVRGLAGGGFRAKRGSAMLDTIAKLSPGLAQGLGKLGVTGKTITTAAISRNAENFMEGARGYQESVERLTNEGVPEEEARRIAGEAIAEQYKRNSLFLLQDIGTFGLLGQAGKAIRSRTMGELASPALPASLRTLRDMPGEALEEAYQYVSEEEASYYADLHGGLVDPVEAVPRFTKYINGEMATSAFGGALGAGVMQYAGGKINKYMEDKMFEKDVADTQDRVAEYLDRELTPDEQDLIRKKKETQRDRSKADITNNLVNANQIIDQAIEDSYKQGRDVGPMMAKKAINTLSMQYASSRDGQNPLTELESVNMLNEMSEAEFNEFFDGEPPISKAEVSELKTIMDRFPNYFEKNMEYGLKKAENIARKMALNDLNKFYNEKRMTELEASMAQDATYQSMEGWQKDYIDLQLKIKGLQRALEQEQNSDARAWLERNLASAQEDFKILKDKQRNEQEQIEGEPKIDSLQSSVEILTDQMANLKLGQSHIHARTNKINKLRESATKNTQKETEATAKDVANQPKAKDTSTSKSFGSGELQTEFSAQRNPDGTYDVNVGEETHTIEAPSSASAIEKARKLKIQQIENEKAELQKQYKEVDGRTKEGKDIKESIQAKENQIEALGVETEEDYIDPSGGVTQNVESPKDLQAGDTVVMQGMSDRPMHIFRGKDGNLYFRLPNQSEERAQQNELQRVEELAFNSNLTLVKDPASAKKEETKSQKQTTDNTPDTPITYNPEPVKKKEYPEQKADAAAWKSIHNPQHQSKDDPEEIAKTRWAETVMDLATMDNQPKFYVQFEINEEPEAKYNDPTVERGSIRAYVYRVADQQPVIESNGEHVYFRVHEPGFKSDGGFQTLNRKYRKQILDIIEDGGTAVAPIIGKGEGTYRFDEVNDKMDVRSMIDYPQGEPIPLAIQNRDNVYVDRSNDTPEGFKHVNFGNPNQVGRVYTTVKALNGNDKVIPLERETLQTEPAEVVADIVDQLVKGTAPGNTVPRALLDKLDGEHGSAIREYIGDSPISYKDLLDLIILEGQITEDLRNDPDMKKRFWVDLKNDTIFYGENSMPFSYFRGNESAHNTLVEWLQTMPYHVQKKRLGEPAYNNMLTESQILYQTPRMPLLIQPMIKFGTPRVKDQNDVDRAVDKASEQLEGANTIEWEGDSYRLEEENGAYRIYPESGGMIDPGSKRGRAILAEAGIKIAKGESQREEDISDEDVQDIMGDLFRRRKEQRLPLEAVGAIEPILHKLEKLTGIPYTIIDSSEAEWAGVYDFGRVFVNLSKAGKDTPFHEYAHPIIAQIKNEQPILYSTLVGRISQDPKYKEIYKRVKKAYPEYNADQAVEETLVQIIGEKAATKPETQGLIEILWDKIKNYIAKLFNRRVNVSDLSTETTLEDIANLLRGEQFIDVEMNPNAYYQKIDSDMTFSEQNSWVNTMIYILMNDSDFRDYRDAKNLDYSHVERRLRLLADRGSQGAQRVYDSLFTDGELNRDSRWFKAISNKLKKFDISVLPEREDRTFDDENSFDFSPDYFFSGKDKASTFVKLMLSTVPKVESVNEVTVDGETYYEPVMATNEYTKMPEYHSFNDIWNTVSYLLSDTVEDFNADNAPMDIFDKFIEKINAVSDLRPELQYLVDMLENAEDWKKSRFVNTFFKANQNYSTLYLEGGKFKLIKNTPTSAEQVLSTAWREEFEDKWVDKDGNVAPKRKEQIQQKYDKFKRAWKSHLKDNGRVTQDFVKGFTTILNDLGFAMEPRAVEYLIRTHASKNNTSQRDAFDFYATRKGLNHLITGDNGVAKLSKVEPTTDTFIEDQQVARTLIRAQAFFSQDLGNSSVFGPGNNTYWNFSNYSMMVKLLDYYKSNPDMLAQLDDMPYYSHSEWRQYIDQMEITNNMSFREEGKEGSKMKSLNPIDRLLVDINKTLQGQFSMLARGANSTEFNLTGPPVEQSYIVQGDTVRLSTPSVKTIAKYVHDEIRRVSFEKKFMATADESELIDGYHTEVTDPETGERYIPAEKIFLMPDVLNKYDISEDISQDEFLKKTDILADIRNTFHERVMEVYNQLSEAGMTDEEINDRITPDNSRYEKSGNEIGTKLYDYVYNGFLANMEQQKLFAADTAMFESVENMQKRILANGSMGQQWYIRKGESDKYNSATIRDAYYDSKVYENYDRINIADAQAWVTLEFYIDALKGYGKWRPKHDDALEAIQAGNPTPDDLALFTQPLKTVAFERVVHNGRIMPIYDKQTILPLVPNLVKGSSLENLLKNMKKQGVDHVTVASGKKLGRLAPTQAIDPETAQFKEEFDLHPVTQSKRFTFLQTEMPTKGRKPQLQGSQQKFLILSDLEDDMEIDGKRAITVVNNIQSAISEISKQKMLDQISTNGKIDSKKLYNKLIELSQGTTVDQNLIDYLESQIPIEAMPAYNFAVQNRAMSMINDAGATIDFSNMFVGIQATRVGFDNLSKREKSDITWLVENSEFKPPRLVDGELKKGQVLVPHSILTEYDLDPSKPEDVKLLQEIVSGVDYRIPTQSQSNMGMVEAIGILPEYMGDTIVVYAEMNEKSGSDNDGDKVNVMFYNYAPSDVRGRPEKVRYWTDTKGEATLREIYEYRTKKLKEDLGTVEEFIQRYSNRDILEANSQQGVENYLLDTYEKIFASDRGFSLSTQKLESEEFRDLILGHENYEQRTIGDLEYASPFFQVKTRDSFINANSGVGQVSNHRVDHVKTQHKGVYALTYDGEGPFAKPHVIKGVETNVKTTADGEQATFFDGIWNQEGKLISNIISMMMDAQVDAEKDDYAPRGNFTTETNSVALAMVRAGVPLKDIVDIIGSDMVRAYSKYKTQRKAQLYYADVDPLKQALEDFGMTEDQMYRDLENPLRIYKEFEKYSAALSESLQQTKFSVAGAGRSFASAIAKEKFMNASIRDLANTRKKFEEGEGPSMEQTYYQNTVGVSRQIFENQSIAYGDSFHMIMDYMQTNTNWQPINLISGDAQPAEDLYFDFYAYMMSGVFDMHNREEMIVGDNTTADKVRAYKRKHGDKNAFVKNLIPVSSGRYELLQTSNAAALDVDAANERSQAWEDLYQEDPDLAIELAHYSYFQSGFKRNMHSFHEYMPKSVHNAMQVSERYLELAKDFNHEGFIEQYIRHNIDNDAIVPRISKKRDVNGKPMDYVRRGDAWHLEKNKKYLAQNGELMQFLKVRVSGDEFTQPYDILLELTEEIDTDEGTFGVYKRTPELGYSHRGNKIHEYNMEAPTGSMFTQIEVPEVKSYITERFSPQEFADKWKERQNYDDNPIDPANCP